MGMYVVKQSTHTYKNTATQYEAAKIHNKTKCKQIINRFAGESNVHK